MSVRNPGMVDPQIRAEFSLRDDAMAGKIVRIVTPATVSTQAPGTAAATRNVLIKYCDSTDKQNIHTWLNKVAYCSVADNSTKFVAKIASTEAQIVNGQCVVAVYSTAGGNKEAAKTNTLTFAAEEVMGYTLAQKTSVETYTT